MFLFIKCTWPVIEYVIKRWNKRENQNKSVHQNNILKLYIMHSVYHHPISHPSIHFFSLGLALLNFFPVAGYDTLSLFALLVEQFLLLL